jgi:hypothetical protein
MFDMKRKEIGVIFMQPAILTTMPGALANEAPNRGIHCSIPGSEESAGPRLEYRDKRAEGNVAAIFSLLGSGELPFAVTGRQAVNVSLQFPIGFERKNSPRRLGGQALAERRYETFKYGRFSGLHDWNYTVPTAAPQPENTEAKGRH